MKNNRKAISKSLRFRIFQRDGFICQYCGARPPDVVLELDHIHPHSKGGQDDEVNLVTSCEYCNRGKRDRVLGEKIVRPDCDLRYAEVQQEIAEARRFLDAQEELDALRPSLIESIDRIFRSVFPYKTRLPEVQINKLLEQFSAGAVADAIREAGRHRPHDCLPYIWAILYKWEHQPEEVDE